MPRPAGSVLPCARCTKIPPGVEPNPANAIEPTDKSRRIYEHYLECEAVGWPEPDRNDPIVKRHARIIAAVTKSVQEAKEAAVAALAVLGRMRE